MNKLHTTIAQGRRTSIPNDCIFVHHAGVSKYNADGSKTDLTDEFSKEGLEQFYKDLGILPENTKKPKPL